jgi:PPP family 3-phenylpropionic acid transporter
MTLRLLPLPRPARFALFYGAFYLGFGAYLPYMPVWFESRGLSPELIGLAAGAGMAGRVIAAPLGAALADRMQKRRHALTGFCIAAALIFAAHIPAQHPGLIVVLAALAGGAYTGIVPIIDAFAIRESKTRGFAFGPPRAIGSAAFIAGNLGCGALIGALGGEAALYWTLTGAGLAVLAALLLPEGRRASAAVRAREHSGLRDVVATLTGAGLPLAFAASALVQGAHGFYYAFSAVAWKAAGVPAQAIGALWATGVAAEIVFFTLIAKYFTRFSPAWLLVIGAGASIVRWGALALAPPLEVLFPLQMLHALTFGATYLGFLRYAADHAPERYGATAQAVNSALSGGLVLAGATYASGYAYAAFGPGGFAVMAAPAALGLACATMLALKGRNAP